MAGSVRLRIAERTGRSSTGSSVRTFVGQYRTATFFLDSSPATAGTARVFLRTTGEIPAGTSVPTSFPVGTAFSTITTGSGTLREIRVVGDASTAGIGTLLWAMWSFGPGSTATFGIDLVLRE